MPQVEIFITSGTTWTVPFDCKVLDSVDCIGAGGSGSVVNSAGAGTSGGTGGAWSRSVNIPVTPGSTIQLQVGIGGAAVARTANVGATQNAASGNPGTDTWFNATSLADAVSKGATLACAAKGGLGGALNAAVAGGAAASGVGSSKFSGGGSAAPGSYVPTGGGGAAGPNGNGNTSSGSTGGSGDAGSGGAAGSPGAEYGTAGSGGGGSGSGGNINANVTGASGGLYGAGGGAAVNDYLGTGIATSGAGRNGMIRILYTPRFIGGLGLTMLGM